MSLNVKSLIFCNDFPVQLTGTKTAKASTARGTNIFNLHMNVFKLDNPF